MADKKVVSLVIAGVGAACVIFSLLLVILLPLSFSYLDFYEVTLHSALKRIKKTTKFTFINLSTVLPGDAQLEM